MSPVERVAAERERRGWSVRRAAQEGGVSNTTWSNFETSGNLTLKMRTAVVAAFGWSEGWPERTPPQSVEQSAGEQRFIDLAEVVTKLGNKVSQNQRSFEERLASLEQTIKALSARLANNDDFATAADAGGALPPDEIVFTSRPQPTPEQGEHSDG